MKRLFLFLTIILSSTIIFGQTLKTQGTQIVNDQGNEVILKGIGLGGWMLMEGYMMHSSDVADTQHEFRDRLIALMGEEKTNEFFDAWLANHVTKKDVDSLAAWGYNSIRLPMHYNLYTLPIEDEPISGENTWLEKGFALTDSLLNWCESNEIYLILDLHAAPGGQGANAAISDYDPSKPSLWESQENRDKTVALWAKLAERYKDEPWIGGYDLINETNWDIPGNVMLKNLFVDITNAIREVDTNHIIYIEGNGFANDFTGLTPPWDDNMAYSFHKYWSFNDQGSIQWVLDMRETHQVPLWMGEGGENSNTWFTEAIELFEGNDIGWSWWPMKRIETIVSPYSIPFTDAYKNILRYWRNEVPQPSVDEAYEAMMELALSTNSSNCLYRKDVHDAKIRQPHTDETLPFSKHEIPGVLYLSDFDLGKNEFAYYDKDVANYGQSTGSFQAWNNGWVYRNDGVDVESNNDNQNSNGFHIGYVNKGEWTQYTTQVLQAGAYQLNVRAASMVNGAEYHLSMNNEDITPTQTTNHTGGWTVFDTYQIDNILLEEGENKIRLHFDNLQAVNMSSIEFLRIGDISNINLLALNGQTRPDEYSVEISLNRPILPSSIENSINDFTLTVNGETRDIENITIDEDRIKTIIFNFTDPFIYTDLIKLSYSGNTLVSTDGKTLEMFNDLKIRNTLKTRFILPRTIQAEDFIYMEGLGIEETTDLGGGYNIGYTNSGDFADYLIYSPEFSFYKINIRVAAQNSEGKIAFCTVDENGVETELVRKVTPRTGGWQTWTTVDVNVGLQQGIHTLRMKIISGELNLNWYEFDIIDGLDENQKNQEINIYPNPIRNNKVIIDLPEELGANYQIEMFNIKGQRIFSKRYNSATKYQEVDIPEIKKGIIVFKITGDNEIYTRKLIKY